MSGVRSGKQAAHSGLLIPFTTLADPEWPLIFSGLPLHHIFLFRPRTNLSFDLIGRYAQKREREISDTVFQPLEDGELEGIKGEIKRVSQFGLHNITTRNQQKKILTSCA